VDRRHIADLDEGLRFGCLVQPQPIQGRVLPDFAQQVERALKRKRRLAVERSRIEGGRPVGPRVSRCSPQPTRETGARIRRPWLFRREPNAVACPNRPGRSAAHDAAVDRFPQDKSRCPAALRIAKPGQTLPTPAGAARGLWPSLAFGLRWGGLS
jgi:hypothetical protein